MKKITQYFFALLAILSLSVGNASSQAKDDLKGPVKPGQNIWGKNRKTYWGTLTFRKKNWQQDWTN